LPFGLDLLRRLFLVSIAVLGNGLALGVRRPGQERDYSLCLGEIGSSSRNPQGEGW